MILNHANCWTEKEPTLAPTADTLSAKLHDLDEERTSMLGDNDYSVDRGMTAISLTLRLNVNKFATLTYYKPKLQAKPKTPTKAYGGSGKTFIEDF